MFLPHQRANVALACALAPTVLQSSVVGQTLSAKQVLEPTDVQGGLIVHVDGTDGKRYDLLIEDVKNLPAEGAHLSCQIGFLDDSWFHRSLWTYG